MPSTITKLGQAPRVGGWRGFRTLIICVLATLSGCASGTSTAPAASGDRETSSSAGPTPAAAGLFSPGGLFDLSASPPCRYELIAARQARADLQRADRARRTAISNLKRLVHYASADSTRKAGYETLINPWSPAAALHGPVEAAADEVRGSFAPVTTDLDAALDSRLGSRDARSLVRSSESDGWIEIVLVDEPRISRWYPPGPDREHVGHVIRGAHDEIRRRLPQAKAETLAAQRYYLRCKAVADAVDEIERNEIRVIECESELERCREGSS